MTEAPIVVIGAILLGVYVGGILYARFVQGSKLVVAMKWPLRLLNL